jgi:hypothetical protein
MQPQTASDLLQIRIRGQRPAGPVVITDTERVARVCRSAGLYAIVWRDGMQLVALRGLECVLYQSRPGGWERRAEELKKAGAGPLTAIARGFKWPEMGIWQSY